MAAGWHICLDVADDFMSGQPVGRIVADAARLMSPGDLGQVLKPFVFLDLCDLDVASFPGIGLHPHTGIATVTYLFEGSVRHEDSTGATGVVPVGGVEWFKSGHGARGTVGARRQRSRPRAARELLRRLRSLAI